MFKSQNERFKSTEEYLNKVRYELSLTLSSRSEPYYDPKELARQFAEDCGLNPHIAANDFGFPYFETFLHSKLMENHVRIDVDSAGRTVYRPHIEKRCKHIVNDQAISHAAIIEKEHKQEDRKMARAMLLENRASLLEGKRRIIDIVHYLEGETKHVCYDQVQKVYEERHQVPLASKELRRLFQRDKPNKIFTMLMHEELELFTAVERPGVIFMKLRAPRDVLFAKFDEFEKAQKEFANRPKQNPYAHLPDRRRHGPKKAPLDASAIRPILPTINLDDDFTTEALFGQKSSESPPVAEKFTYNEPAVSSDGKLANSAAAENFNRLWNNAEKLTYLKVSNSDGRVDDRSSDDEPPTREFGKNVPRLADKSKPLKWTRRAENGVFTSDEEDDEKEEKIIELSAQAPSNKNDSASANKHNLPQSLAKATAAVSEAASVVPAAIHVQWPSSSSRKFVFTSGDDSEPEERNVRIKSRKSNKSSDTRPVFSSSSEEKEGDGKKDAVVLTRNGGQAMYLQSTRGTLSKPIRGNLPSVGTRDDNDGIFSPYSMLDEANNDENYYGRHVSMDMPLSSSVISQSRRPTVDSYSTRHHSVTTTRQRTSNELTSSAYSTFGSGLSSISRSMTADRSGYSLQSQMAMTSFEFLKFKQATRERVQYMSYFISTVVLYRSPEAIEYQALIDIIDKLDNNYEMVLGGTSFLEFVEANCPNVAVLVHRDSVVFGWHPSKNGCSISGSYVGGDSDGPTIRVASR